MILIEKKIDSFKNRFSIYKVFNYQGELWITNIWSDSMVIISKSKAYQHFDILFFHLVVEDIEQCVINYISYRM